MPIVCKADEQQIVMGEVYSPNRPDAQGEFMTTNEIRKMAHEFIQAGKSKQIDLLHNGKVVKGCSVVESFISDEHSPTFIPGSWVVAVHIPDKELWQSVKKGEINGFSMEAFVSRKEKEVEVEIPPVVSGMTSKSEDHQHRFYVNYDDKGDFRGGTTDYVNGHCHVIKAGTVTQDAEGHSHRFSSVDNVQIVV